MMDQTDQVVADFFHGSHHFFIRLHVIVVNALVVAQVGGIALAAVDLRQGNLVAADRLAGIHVGVDGHVGASAGRKQIHVAVFVAVEGLVIVERCFKVRDVVLITLLVDVLGRHFRIEEFIELCVVLRVVSYCTFP